MSPQGKTSSSSIPTLVVISSGTTLATHNAPFSIASIPFVQNAHVAYDYIQISTGVSSHA